MSHPPKSTIRAPSARWLSLRMVLRVMARSGCGNAPIIPDRTGAGPAPPRTSVVVTVVVVGVAAISGRGGTGVATAAMAVACALDLQGGVVDVETLAQQARGALAH